MDDESIKLTLEPNLGEWESAAKAVLSADELRTVFTRSINDAIKKGKTEGLSEATAQYMPKRKELDKNVRLHLAKSGDYEPSGMLEFKGARLPLRLFKVGPKTGVRQKGVAVSARDALSIQIRKDGGGKTPNPLFVATMVKSSGHKDVWLRDPKGTRGPSGKEKLIIATGPSIVSMVGNDRAVERIQTAMQELMDKRIDHHIRQAMNK